MKIDFGEWLPDLPPLGNPGLTEISNAVPDGVGYLPVRTPTVYSSTLSSVVHGAMATLGADGTGHIFAGTEDGLFHLSAAGGGAWDTFTRPSSSGGAYAVPADGYWNFAVFGNTVLATNFADPIQAYDLSGAITNFTNLAGSPPQARHIAVVRDFLMVGNTYDPIDGNVPTRVRWSGASDITAWTPSVTTQSDYQDLPGRGGWVQGIATGVAGADAIIFQEHAVTRCNYIGSSIIFQFDEVEGARGCAIPGSIRQVGGRVFYVSDDGFYIFDGASSVPIGNHKVDAYFFDDVDTSYYHHISTSIDPERKCIWMAYPGQGNVGGSPNRILIYNWATGRWSKVDYPAEWLFLSMALGLTLDQLDVVSGSLDALAFSLDSRIWGGNGATYLGLFCPCHNLRYFTGSQMAARFETGEVRVGEGRSRITEVWPLVDGATATVTMGRRDLQSNTVSWGTPSTTNSTGKCPVRANAHYHRVRLDISASTSWTTAMGLMIPDSAITPAGGR